MSRRFSAAVMVIVAGAAMAGQAPSFSTQVEAVRVDALVTENGKLVTGLQPGDFEVFDNGVLQNVDLASYEDIPLNVVLALDLSGSLTPEQLDHLRSAGNTLLDGLAATDQAALVTFNHVVAQESPLTSELARVRSALSRAKSSGQTSLIDATFMGMLIAESDVGRALLIVFSDGVDTRSWLTGDAVVETAKRSDVVVYNVGVGRHQPEFSRDLSGATGGRLIQVESTKDVNATFRKILEEFRQRYLISYSPQGVARGGWHRLEVRVKGRSAQVRARQGYGG
jgi:Ca-activated chloride channel family protein